MTAHAHHLTRDQVVALLDERDTLRETVRQYEDLLCPAWPVPTPWGIRGRPADFLCAVRSASPNVLHRERGIIAIYGMIDGAPDQKILDVLVCKVRRRLKSSGSGIVIETVWGRGWRLDEDNAARFDDAVAAERERRAAAERQVAGYRPLRAIPGAAEARA